MSATQRLRLALASVLGVILAVVAFATPATATPYTHHRPTTSVSNSHPAPGSTVTFCGAGFRPGETVTITIGHTGYPSVTAGGGGVWCTSVDLSSSLRGKVKLTASSTTSHRSSTTKINVGKRNGGHGSEQGDDRGEHGDDRGENDDDDARVSGLSATGGSNWTNRVLGQSATGGSNWFDRVLDRT
jgi:hypothetical protein